MYCTSHYILEKSFVILVHNKDNTYVWKLDLLEFSSCLKLSEVTSIGGRGGGGKTSYRMNDWRTALAQWLELGLMKITTNQKKTIKFLINSLKYTLKQTKIFSFLKIFLILLLTSYKSKRFNNLNEK